MKFERMMRKVFQFPATVGIAAAMILFQPFQCYEMAAFAAGCHDCDTDADSNGGATGVIYCDSNQCVGTITFVPSKMSCHNVRDTPCTSTTNPILVYDPVWQYNGFDINCFVQSPSNLCMACLVAAGLGSASSAAYTDPQAAASAMASTTVYCPIVCTRVTFDYCCMFSCVPASQPRVTGYVPGCTG